MSTLPANDPGGQLLLAVETVMSVVCILVVLLRIIAVRVRHRSPGSHDYACLLALVCMIAMTATTFIGVMNAGWGMSIQRLSMSKFSLALKLLIPLFICYTIGVAAIRMSILLLLLSIFPMRWFRITSFLIGSIVVAYCIAGVLLTVLTCQPVQYQWNKTIPGGHCMNFQKILLNSAGGNLVLDAIFVFLPIPLIWRLKMLPMRTLLIASVVCLGALNLVVNICRVWKTAQEPPLKDPTEWISIQIILVHAEVCTGILAACMPTVCPLFVSYRRRNDSPDTLAWKPRYMRHQWRRRLPRGPLSTGTLLRSSHTHSSPQWLYETSFARPNHPSVTIQPNDAANGAALLAQVRDGNASGFVYEPAMDDRYDIDSIVEQTGRPLSFPEPTHGNCVFVKKDLFVYESSNKKRRNGPSHEFATQTV